MDDINSELLCDNYKKVFAKYINSKVRLINFLDKCKYNKILVVVNLITCVKLTKTFSRHELGFAISASKGKWNFVERTTQNMVKLQNYHRVPLKTL